MVFSEKLIFKNKGEIHVGRNAPTGFLPATIQDVKETLKNLNGKKIFRCYVCNDLSISSIPPKTCPTCFQKDAYIEINEKELRVLLEIT